MTAPVFVTDDTPSADQVNKWFVNMGWARKSSDQTITSSTTLVNDADLALSVDASTDYMLEMVLDYSSASTTPDFQWNLTGPSGATFNGVAVQFSTTATDNTGIRMDRVTMNTPNASGTIIGHQAIQILGLVRVSTTAGTLQLQWAQNTSNGTGTILYTNSFMRLTRVA